MNSRNISDALRDVPGSYRGRGRIPDVHHLSIPHNSFPLFTINMKKTDNYVCYYVLVLTDTTSVRNGTNVVHKIYVIM